MRRVLRRANCPSFLSFMAIRHRYMPALAMSHHGRPSTAPLGALRCFTVLMSFIYTVFYDLRLLRWCVVRFRGRVHPEVTAANFPP